MNHSYRWKALILPGLLALAPGGVRAQTAASPSPTAVPEVVAPAVVQPQAVPPMGGIPRRGMMGRPMGPMGATQAVPPMAGMDCMGKPCGPPPGTPRVGGSALQAAPPGVATGTGPTAKPM